MTQLTVQTKLVAQKAGVPCLDLSSGVIPNDRSHYYDQFHFTPKGAAVAGSIAAEMILDVAGLNGGGGRVGHPAGQLSVAR